MCCVQDFREGRIAPTFYDIWERDCVIEDEEEDSVDEIYELFLQFKNEPNLFEYITGLTLR